MRRGRHDRSEIYSMTEGRRHDWEGEDMTEKGKDKAGGEAEEA